jgi:phosphonate metabolim protein, transferase hexapeptide repeat family
MKTLGLEPSIHPTARVHESILGRYTEVGAGCHVSRSSMGDYSYCVENTQIAYATIGKFANIAAHVRIYASKHPMERASLHHFTYRSSWYFEGEEDDQDFFDWRAGQGTTIGHDTWIGHGAVVMPGVTIGNGAIIGSNAVVTRDVAAFAIAVGVPARTIRQRFSDDAASRLDALAWWDWEHEKLHAALPDFRTLGIEAFLEKYEG